ncbi:MAG: glycosyl hydrolase, partial [Acidobacteriota bacterium]|nr:glycosyl hydrolase [Acidobacteriota bacterium]
IDTSTFDAGTAYLAVDRHELDDFGPYIYKTTDFGRSWEKITNNIPDNTFVRVVREDTERKGLLYAGTETGVFVSFDDGKGWQSLQLNLPVVPIHDMVVKNNDLVAATHGRSFWILDDLTPLHQISDEMAKSDVFLFKPRDAFRMGGWSYPRPNVGKNPPGGSVIYYYLKEKPGEEIKLEFLDNEGNLIKKFTSRAKGEEGSRDSIPMRSRSSFTSSIPAEAGMNRFVWNMRYPDAERVPGAILWAGRITAPIAVPGKYQVRLTVGEEVKTQAWEWKKDPRLLTTQEDFQEQFDFMIKVRDKTTEVNRGVNKLRAVEKQVNDLLHKIKDFPGTEQIVKAGKELNKKLKEVEDVLIQSKSKSGQDPLNYPILLDDKIAGVASVVASADSRPTDQSYEVFKELSEKADEQILKLKKILESDIPAFNKLVREAGIPAIILKHD